MQMPLLRGDFGGERVNGGRNKASAFTGKRILTENVGPRTCLPVFHKLSTAIRGIPASMVKNTLRVLRQRQRVCTSFCFALTKKMQHFLLFAGRGMLARGTLVGGTPSRHCCLWPFENHKQRRFLETGSLLPPLAAHHLFPLLFNKTRCRRAICRANQRSTNKKRTSAWMSSFYCLVLTEKMRSKR